MPDRLARLRDLVVGLVQWAFDLRSVRAVKWYLARRGNLLCGGIAYSALFSLGAALTIGVSAFSATLGSRPELKDQVFKEIDAWVPGLLKEDPSDPDDPGLVDPASLVLDSAWSWTTAVAAVVFLWTAISVMGALRHSVRSMFDAPVVGVNFVLSKVWQLVGFLLLGVMLVTTAAASIVSQTVRGQITRWFGDSIVLGWTLSLGSYAVSLVLDAVLVYLIVRIVAQVRPRRTRDLVLGCLIAGLATSALRLVGTSLVSATASRNAILASFVTLAAVLVLVNFVARVLLLVCAWVYDPPRLDEIERAEQAVAAMQREAEIERQVHRGRGSGRPYSPVVRGVRRGLYDY
ncbi:YihY/virulence factor BrkB family protein [Isoptericola sp. S6320L]|uniref:YihY/virulence factor BrkB family protein n=1 Tax=Isoptericola sp. S6320L TaxID=2926411 RepID=UPI001FF377D7|nr:YihY/virulence factor BrkB family protein [Isoptericola sp. S6320L]MCK0116891.1 YihY/virulence factor BrkB family protein [Isoptericola sp. S6320L]